MSDEQSELDNLVTTVETTDDSQSDQSGQQPGSPGEKDETPPVSAKSEPEMVPLAKAQAEKSRRKEVERENEALKQQIADSVEEPDAFAEPDKAIKHETDKVRAEMYATFRGMSEASAKKAHEDYDDMFDLFKDMCKTQPYLIDQMKAEFDPGEFVYQTASRHKTLESMGDISKIQSEMETLRAENEALKKGEAPADVPDLTTARSTGGDPDSGISEGNDGLEQLLDATRR